MVPILNMFVNTKWACVCILFILASTTQSTKAQDGSNDLVNKIETFYNNKCYTHSQNSYAFDKLKANAYEFIKYAEYTFTFIPANKKHFCKNERPQLILRVDELANNLKACLPTQEQYLPTFLRDSFKEFLHFLCHKDGENIDSFFSYGAQNCRQALEKDQSDTLDRCFGKIFSPLKGYVKKEEMCEDFNVAKKCFAQVLEMEPRCSSNQDIKTLNEKFFNYVKKPCNGGVAFSANNWLLLISVLFFVYNKVSCLKM